MPQAPVPRPRAAEGGVSVTVDSGKLLQFPESPLQKRWNFHALGVQRLSLHESIARTLRSLIEQWGWIAGSHAGCHYLTRLASGTWRKTDGEVIFF